jgi:tetratricopeptide (TPR) repeat protein
MSVVPAQRAQRAALGRSRLRAGPTLEPAAASPAAAAPAQLLTRLPPPTGIFVGRIRELEQLERGLRDVAVAVVYGVPGIGKSTLALAHGTHWPGQAGYLKLTEGASLSHVVAALQRQRSTARSEPTLDDVDRLDELWARFDDAAALVVIDDLHHLDATSRTLVVTTAGQRLCSGRLIATSRELVPIAAGMPDRLQLRLEGLDRGEAAQLWERLRELYGPSGDFEVAWRRSHGNAYLLRQAHVATLTEDHPLRALVRSLAPEERRVAGAVALSHVPLPAGILGRLVAGDAAAATLDRLVTRLIVDAQTDSRYAMHDVTRELVLQELEPALADEVRAVLVDALPDSELDAAAILQERCRHLRALGRFTEMAELLLATSADLIRQGATIALLHELDALPAEVCGPEIQHLLARALTRSISHTRRAYEELRRVVADGGAPRAMRLLFAIAAMKHGELAEAEQTLRALIDSDGAPPALRRKAEYHLAWVLAYAGRYPEAVGMADERDRAAGPDERVAWLTLRAFTHMAAGDEGAAADLAGELIELIEPFDAAPGDRPSHRFATGLCAVLLSRAGRLDEAERAVRVAERGLQRPADSIEIAWVRIAIRHERGERIAALEEFRIMQRLFDRSEDLIGQVWTRAYVGRVLLLLGRRREALMVLSEALEQCRVKGATGLGRIAELALDEDPLAPGWLSRDRAVPPQGSKSVRTRVHAALRRAWMSDGAPGHPQHVDATIPATADHAFDRALLELARVAPAARRGRGRLAANQLQRAMSCAAECEADPELVPALHEQLETAVAGRAPDASSGASLVIDGIHHQVVDGAVRVALTSRLILRRLLYEFVAADHYHLDRNTIAHALWASDYAPLRHESSVKSNIRRLRDLLGQTRLVIQTERDGYRLRVPPGTVVVPPDDHAL